MRGKQFEEASVNLTPMIDVVFLLVIFFMVGSHFSHGEGRVDVNVQTASQLQSIARAPDQRVVTVSADGQIALDGQPTNETVLTQTLQQQLASYPALRVAVRGDGEVRHQRMVRVLVAVQASGVQDISIAERRLQR